MSKITLDDTRLEAIAKVAEGNPGAFAAILDMMNVATIVDPQSFMGELTPLITLDEHEIYGTDVYVLWNDKCDRDPRKVLILLRAVQLGMLNASRLKELAGDQDRVIDISAEEFTRLDKQVCERLEEFQKPQEK